MPQRRLPPLFDRIALTPRLRWAVTGAGAAALAILLWHLGPLLALGGFRPLEEGFPRVLLIALGLGGWALANRRADERDRRANARLVEALAARSDADLRAAVDELDSVRERFQDALKRLRTERFGAALGGRYLYQLPWYLVIGAPGSGKTTAIANARLGSPLTGTQPIHGIGGTRTCDWWFTDRAVLIDTAGRYTTQDSRGAVDGRVWTGILDLLKEQRPRQPLNGVILTVSLSDLATWSEAERRQHAHLLRQRLAETRLILGMRPPVYVVCTKADLVSGFSAFFDVLGEDERRQIWGATFPVAERRDEGGIGERFRDVYLGLLRRLDERLLERLHQEPDTQRRSLTFSFPLQMAALEGPLAELLAGACATDMHGEPPLIRGVYFVSATQRGAPVDPLAHGLPPLQGAALSTPQGETGSFFLERLLPDVVFPEANLAGVDRAVEARRRRVDALTLGGSLAAAAALLALWTVSYDGNAALIERAATATEVAASRIRALDAPPRSLTRVEDTDFAAVMPVLDALRALPNGYGERGQGRPFTLTGGLYQGDRLGRQADQVYRRALRSVFLSRVVLRLEEQLRTSWARPDLLARALDAYLMVGGRRPLDPAFLAQWMAADWQRTLSGSVNEGNRRALGDHLAALLSVGFAPIPVDDVLVDRAAKVLRQSGAGRAPS